MEHANYNDTRLDGTSHKPRLQARDIALGASVVLAVVLMVFVVYVSSGPDPVSSEPVLVLDAEAPVFIPAEEPAQPPPVRVVNPFDDSEVFEFPAGTSEREAHDRVAELLLERARERLHRFERATAFNRVRGMAR